MEAFLTFVLKALLFLVAAFMILLVLIQRGKGGGLTGALGGMGGQSAFGTKAGDVFTRVTIVAAAIWILLCAAAVKMFKPPSIEDTVATGIGATAPVPPTGQPAPNGAAPNTEAPADTTPPATPPAASETPTPETPAAETPATPPNGAGS